MEKDENMIDVLRIARGQMDKIAAKYYECGTFPENLDTEYEMVWKYINCTLNSAISREDFEKNVYSPEDFYMLVHSRYIKKVWLNTLKSGKTLKLTSRQKVAELNREENGIRVEYYTVYCRPEGARSEGEFKFFEASTDKDILDVCFNVKREINQYV